MTTLYVVSLKCIPITKSCFIYHVCLINIKVIKMIYIYMKIIGLLIYQVCAIMCNKISQCKK
jgi:hypothetical protein